jgi:fructose-1,6-bisphosphatase
MALLIERDGGDAFDGKTAILDVGPTGLTRSRHARLQGRDRGAEEPASRLMTYLYRAPACSQARSERGAV